MVMNSNAAYFKNQVQSNEKIKSCRPKDPIIPKWKENKNHYQYSVGIEPYGLTMADA